MWSCLFLNVQAQAARSRRNETEDLDEEMEGIEEVCVI